MALSKINTNQIVDGAVATADIADGLITTAKLADGAVTTAKITDGNISTAKLADDAVTNAKVADNAVANAQLADNAVGTSEIADDAVTTAKVNPSQTDITSVGTLSSLNIRNSSSTGPALSIGTTSTSVADGGFIGGIMFDAGTSNTACARIQALSNGTDEGGADFSFECRDSGASFTEKMRITGDGKVGIGINDPSHQLHIESSGSNSYATMKLEGQNRGGQIDMFQNTLITNQILGDQSGNLYIGSSGGFGQVALDSQLQLNSNNKAFAIKNSTFLTSLADDASRNIVSNGQGLIIVTAYSEGLTCIARHEYQNIVQIISANSLWSNTDTDGKYCLLSGTNDYSITLKNRLGGNRSLKALFVGTYQ